MAIPNYPIFFFSHFILAQNQRTHNNDQYMNNQQITNVTFLYYNQKRDVQEIGQKMYVWQNTVQQESFVGPCIFLYNIVLSVE